MEPTQLALDCLKMAVASAPDFAGSDEIVGRARAFFAFACSPAQSPRETINAALDAADVR